MKLLLISIGPVQGFIAQARRTRDHWFGSALLSSLAHTCAEALIGENGVELIFPAPSVISRAGNGEKRRQPPIANKVLALVGDGVEPELLAKRARSAVFDKWQAIAERVFKECKQIIAEEAEPVYREQVADFLEFNCVWGSGEDYVKLRRSLETELAGRKAARPFRQWQNRRDGVPKSSLDGDRESVLKPGAAGSGVGKRLRLGGGEHLDAIGLIKRTALGLDRPRDGREGDEKPASSPHFPSILNVTAVEWLRGLDKAVAEGVLERSLADELRTGADELFGRRQFDAGWKVSEVWPYDGALLFPERVGDLFAELEQEGFKQKCWEQLLDSVRAAAKGRGLRGEPTPYVACLRADGDRMGETIGRLDSPSSHQEFSEALQRFAKAALELVDSEFGLPVYAGGDDLLAFVPVSAAVRVAGKLRARFGEELEDFGDGQSGPTLSVGIGVGHVLEGMAELLALATEAERLAKEGEGQDPPRNALAIVWAKRSGARLQWRARWDRERGPETLFKQATEVAREGLSVSGLHRLEALANWLPARAAPGTEEETEEESHLSEENLRRLLWGEINRIVGHLDQTPERLVGLLLGDGEGSYAELRRRLLTGLELLRVAHEIGAIVGERGVVPVG
jgi:CRISPR-associated protein Cmr2